MGIDEDGRLPEGMVEDDACGLSSDSRKGQKILHPGRDGALESGFDRLGKGFGVESLSSKEPCGAQDLLEFGKVGLRKGGGCRVARKESGGDPIDRLVCCLRRQDGRHQEFEGGMEVKFGGGVRDRPGKPVEDL